jgi:hypothetical protein
MTTRPARPALYVRPDYQVFGPKDRGKLLAALEKLTASTLITPPESIAALRLGDDGALKGGYRFTTTGFRQVCNLLSVGLFAYTRDIAGIDRGEHPQEEFDFAAAAAAYNRALQLRFARLEDYRLLRNVTAKQVEGVLGPRYVSVDNAAVLEYADVAAECHPDQPQFFAAALAGRLLWVRYAAPAVYALAPDSPGGYSIGLHFVNSEIGGESTFRAAPLLCDRHDGAAALAPWLGGRQRHTGVHFHETLARIFAESACVVPVQGKLQRGLDRLAARSLNLEGLDYEARAERLKHLAAWLRGHQVLGRSADRIVAVAAQGAVAGMPRPGARAPATHLALFQALTRHGCSLHAGARETVERLAYDFLIGKLKF